MIQELTEIKIPDAIQKALQERYEETGKLSSLNATKLMSDVPGTTRVDAQIYIALFKESANPIHPDSRIRRQICDIICDYVDSNNEERTQMLMKIADLVF